MSRLIAYLQKPTHLILILLSLLPPLFALNFGLRYAENVPVIDQWCHSVPAVISAMEGDFEVSYIWQQHNAHRIAPTTVITLIFAYLTDWNQQTEALFNLVLILVNIVILVMLLRGSDSKLDGVTVTLSILLFSALLYSLKLRSIWLWSYSSPYVLGYTFLLVPLLILQRTKPGWLPLMGIALCAFIASFAIGSSFMLWLLLPVGLAIFGYRDWRHYTAWVGSIAVTVLLYFFILDFEWVDNGNFCLSYLQIGERMPLLDFITLYPVTLLRILSSPFLNISHEDMYERFVYVGAAVFLMIAVNFIYLTVIAWRERNFRNWFVWVSLLALSVGGVSVALYSRSGFLFWVRPIFVSTYAIQPTMAIITTVAVGFLLYRHINNKPSIGLLDNLVKYLNLLALVGMIGLWVNINYTSANTQANPIGEFPGIEPSPENARCMRNYFFSDDNCYDDFFVGEIYNPDEEQYRQNIEKLAEYRLTAFAEIRFTLPETYDGTQSVIVYAPLAEQQLPVYDNNGRQVDESLIYRVVNEDETEWMARYGAQNLILINEQTNANTIYEQIPDGIIWYLGLPDERGNNLAEVINDQRGYVWVNLIPPAVSEDYELEAAQYGTKRPNQLDQPIWFENLFKLTDWQLRDNVNQSDCNTVTVNFWIEGQQNMEVDYSMGVALVSDVDGSVLARDDRALGAELGTSDWYGLTSYWDQRTVTIPCEAEAGSYSLIAYTYDYLTPDEPFTVQNADGEPIGTFLYLTTIFVE